MNQGDPATFFDLYLATHVTVGEMAVRMGLAVVLGGLIGFEREIHNRAAGLRTHMLVSLASATFTLVTIDLSLQSIALDESIGVDPVRLIQAVVAGVAFLGAGAIIQSRQDVRGLTTGAGIWIAGAIGVACGGGFYITAAIAAALTVSILWILGVVQAQVKAKLEDPESNEDNNSP